MAQRDGQGLQIAVIVFAMLTIILAITTYVFYAQSQTAQKDLDAKTKSLNEKQNENNKLLGRVTAMNYVLGLKGVTKQDVDLAVSRAGDDADVKEILDSFDKDMALVGGEQVAPDGPRSYRTFVSSLLAALGKKNASVSDANDQARKAQKDKDDAEKAALARAEAAEGLAKTAADTYKTESEKFTAAHAQMEEQNKKLQDQITTGALKAKTDLQKATDETANYVKANTQLQSINKSYLDRLKEHEKERASLFESPDGHVKFVNQNLRTVWIDVGRKDGLLRQTTFSVYDHDENGVSSAKPKGRIEVVSMGDDLSEARILEDTPRNPIIGGDVIFTPAWSPGQRVHFALAMKMDINKDRIDDYDLVKNIILMNGGVIDAEMRVDSKGNVTRTGEITVSTRYFVQGEKTSEASSQEVINKFNAFDQERERFGVEKIPVEKLLSLMGWKAEERTVELAGSRAGGDFRKRSPGKTQPAANGSTPAAPASEAPAAPAAPAASDPFGTPAAPAPAPAPAVDPFAAPAPAGKAAPAAEADPFATPK
jgi:type II secretory pathway pseudopilin PulG